MCQSLFTCELTHLIFTTGKALIWVPVPVLLRTGYLSSLDLSFLIHNMRTILPTLLATEIIKYIDLCQVLANGRSPINVSSFSRVSDIKLKSGSQRHNVT